MGTKVADILAEAADTAVMADMATTAAAVTKAASKINLSLASLTRRLPAAYSSPTCPAVTSLVDL